MTHLRKNLYRLVEPSVTHSGASYLFDLLIIILILLNIVGMIIASEPDLDARVSTFLDQFETVSVVIFTMEYLLRLWTIVESEQFRNPIKGRIRFILTPMAIIDLLAILPFYLPFVGVDLRFLRILRLFRVFRLLKMARYSKAFDMIKVVIWSKKEDLAVTTVLIAIVLIISSTLMYYIEGEAQPEHFSSISKAIWWGVCTITTVGYGDVVPVTGFGKILGGLLTILGIALIALPAGILASGYTEQHHRNTQEDR